MAWGTPANRAALAVWDEEELDEGVDEEGDEDGGEEGVFEQNARHRGQDLAMRLANINPNFFCVEVIVKWYGKEWSRHHILT